MLRIVCPLWGMDYKFPKELVKSMYPDMDLDSLITNIAAGKDFKAHELGYMEINDAKIKLLLQVETADAVLD